MAAPYLRDPGVADPRSAARPGPRTALPRDRAVASGPQLALPRDDATTGGPSAWSRLGTVGAVVASLFSSLVAVTYAGLGSEPARVWLDLLAVLAAAGTSVSLVWRRRWPAHVCLGSAAATLLLPLDGLATLVALSWVIASSGRRRTALCSVATALAVAVALGRDLAREGESVVWSLRLTDGGAVRMTVAGYVVMGALLLATAVAAGLVRRYRAAAGVARDAARTAEAEARAALDAAGDEARRAEAWQSQADALRSHAADLRSELSRQEERELIAREIHDTVAHELSLLSLRASALEVTADDGATDVRDAARGMRSTAHRGMEAMRVLVSSLRSAGDGFADRYAGGVPRLSDLPGLVDEARRAGVDIGATVFVDEAATAPAALTRAVYRVVQESLTNAMKHAPGTRVDVDVRARPGAGAEVVVRNALPAGPLGTPTSTGGGAGLVGMRERAQSLGGTFEAGPVDGCFEVRAHLPWEGRDS